MSRWTAPSDREWEAEHFHAPADQTTRACTRCGHDVPCSLNEEYTITILCPDCWRTASETQARKMDRGAA